MYVKKGGFSCILAVLSRFIGEELSMSKQKWIDMRGNKKKAVAVGADVGAIGIMILAVAGVLPTIAG